MPPRTNAFQRLITMINATLAGDARIVESAMLADKVTAQPREVDILITASAAGYSVNIAIEVVGRSRKADAPWVEGMRAKHANLPTDKLILVSEQGFSRPAIAKAKFYGIETLTIERACSTDWGILATLTATGIFELTTLRYDCALVCRFEDGRLEQIEAPLHASIKTATETLSLDEYIRRLMDVADVRTVLDQHINGAGEHEFWMSYTQPGGLWQLEYNNELGQATELRIGLHIERSETPVQYASGKYADRPFIAGESAQAISAMQFVLTRLADGSVRGLLVDPSGVRTLSSNEK